MVATFLGLTGPNKERARFEKSDGVEYTFPLDRLSEEDRLLITSDEEE
jgi:hypothetical protein